MKILIIEDEPITARELQYVLQKLDKNIEILDIIDNIETALEFLSEEQPDLIFSDIQLADGTCFDIFSKIDLTCPVVFCTAFNGYAIETFINNDIAYVLKPFNVESVQDALDKVKDMTDGTALYNHEQEIVIETLSRLMKDRTTHKPSFIAKRANRWRPFNKYNFAIRL